MRENFDLYAGFSCFTLKIKKLDTFYADKKGPPALPSYIYTSKRSDIFLTVNSKLLLYARYKRKPKGLALGFCVFMSDFRVQEK